MSLFKKAESTSAYLKAGFLGGQGGGKTRTATELAIGIAKLSRDRKLKEAGKPIYFIDSETGSDYVKHIIERQGFELQQAKTRSFVDLLTAIDEAEKHGSALIIDSITHFWREFVNAYRKKKGRQRLEMLDWVPIKEEWSRFTDAYVNSNLHIIMCGRMGYEYEHETDEDTGKKQLIKTDVKMKAEGETGYEPSILVLMERETDVKTNQVTRVGYVLKERFDVIDGKTFRNPTFEDFRPHVEMLNLGGAQLGVDTSRTSEDVFNTEGDTRWAYERKQKAIALEEVQEEMVRMYPGQTAGDKKAKADLLEQLFGTRSWTAVENKSLDTVKDARNRLWKLSRGHGYGETPPQEKAEELKLADEPAAEQPQVANG